MRSFTFGVPANLSGLALVQLVSLDALNATT